MLCVEALVIVFFIFFRSYYCVTYIQVWTERWQKSESITERPREFRGSSLRHTKSKEYYSGQIPSFNSPEFSLHGSISKGGIIQNHV